MNANDIHTAAVLGAGTMGHGIAQVLAMSGIETRLFDIDAAAVDRGIEAIGNNLQKGVERGKLTADQCDDALANLSGGNVMSSVVDGVQLVVEAVPEKLELKQQIFEELDQRLRSTVLLATNTSALSIKDIAKVTQAPERVVGMHFFNPVHIMKLVEVVETELSSDEAVTCAMDLARRMGKEPIRVKDSPGFASSRLGLVIGLEAMRMVESGVASAEDIDKAMTLGYGFPIGPLALTDLVGLDVRLSIAEFLKNELGPGFEPPAILREMVARGELGKKSGKGFYDYSK